MRRLLNTFIPNKIWLASSLIFLLLANGITKGRELVLNSYFKTGNLERAESFIWNNVIEDYGLFALVLISFLAVTICQRKDFKELVHVMNHLHWLLLLFFIIGSQLVLKGEN
ncbi:MAG: hypothetical protein KDJ75_04275 [Alphaproteobacteria bacterium]|nr:hypothetical protein [Alphaproteobacteria bacterium]